MSTIISRAEAKAQGLKHFYTGKPCKHGHLSKQFVSSRVCCACDVERKRADKVGRAAWRAENREKIAVQQAAWYAANREARAAYSAAYRATPDGRAIRNADAARRRAALMRATPEWADDTAIAAIYREAVELELTTGESYHVDHVVPLQSAYVCGLHVPANLRPLPGAENLSKNNCEWEDMPEHLDRKIAYPKKLRDADLEAFRASYKEAREVCERMADEHRVAA